MSLAARPGNTGTAPDVEAKKLRSIDKLSALVFCLCVVVVSIATAVMGFRGMLPLPLFDDWGFLNTEDLARHLFTPHNEHLIVLTKLVFLADLQMFHGSHILFWYASTFFLLALGAIYWAVAGCNPEITLVHKIVAAAIVLELAISPLTIGSLVWAMHLQNTAAPAFAALAFAVLVSLWPPGKRAVTHHTRVFAALMLTACASFTSGSGAPAPLLLFVQAIVMRLPKRDLCIFAVGGILIEGIYLRGNSAQDHAVSTILSSGTDVPKFLFLFLGSLIPQALTLSDAMQYPGPALLCGIASVVVLCICFLRFLRGYRAGDRNQFALFTLICGAFFLSAAALVTAGRLPFGMPYSYTEHYNLLRSLYWASVLVCIPASWGSERSWRVAITLGLCASFVLLWQLPARAKGMLARRLSLNVSSAAVMAEVFDPEAWERNNRWNNMDLAHEQFAAEQTARLRRQQSSVFHSPIAMTQDMAKLAVLGNSCVGSILSSKRGMDQKGLYTKVTGSVRGERETGKFPELILVNSQGRVTGFAAISVQGKENEWIGYARSGEPPANAYLFQHGQFCRLKGDVGLIPVPHIEDDPHEVNLVHDPSFETGIGWTFTKSPGFFTGRISNGSAYHNPPTPDGVLAVALQQLGSFSQSIQGLKPGDFYQLRFYVAGRPSESGAGGSQAIVVFLDGVKTAQVSVSSGQSYRISTISFRASHTQMLLEFRGLAPTDETAFIDKVSVVRAGSGMQHIPQTKGRRE